MTKFMARNSITVIILVINLVIRELLIYIVMLTGYDTISDMVTAITNAVFITQFFNTGILLLLVYGNLEEVGVSVLKGPFYDFSPEWYAIVGYSIVQTMAINAFLPLFFETYPILLKWLI